MKKPKMILRTGNKDRGSRHWSFGGQAGVSPPEFRRAGRGPATRASAGRQGSEEKVRCIPSGFTTRQGRRLNPKKGFTLIEVLVAASILAIGLVGVLRAYATSATAMEKALQDMDTAYLFKIAMGKIEEKAITEGKVVPGVSNGNFGSDLDMKRSGPWLWSQEVQRMDLPSKKVKQDLANKKIKSDTEKEKKSDFDLNKLKLTIVNSGRIPLREVSLETYVRTESVKRT